MKGTRKTKKTKKTKDPYMHLRCYVAMIRARDRCVAAGEPCNCFKTDAAACPECRVGANYDECFMCRGCGNAYGYCECTDEERAANPRQRDDMMLLV